MSEVGDDGQAEQASKLEDGKMLQVPDDVKRIYCQPDSYVRIPTPIPFDREQEFSRSSTSSDLYSSSESVNELKPILKRSRLAAEEVKSPFQKRSTINRKQTRFKCASSEISKSAEHLGKVKTRKRDSRRCKSNEFLDKATNTSPQESDLSEFRGRQRISVQVQTSFDDAVRPRSRTEVDDGLRLRERSREERDGARASEESHSRREDGRSTTESEGERMTRRPIEYSIPDLENNKAFWVMLHYCGMRATNNPDDPDDRDWITLA